MKGNFMKMSWLIGNQNIQDLGVKQAVSNVNQILV